MIYYWDTRTDTVLVRKGGICFAPTPDGAEHGIVHFQLRKTGVLALFGLVASKDAVRISGRLLPKRLRKQYHRDIAAAQNGGAPRRKGSYYLIPWDAMGRIETALAKRRGG